MFGASACEDVAAGDNPAQVLVRGGFEFGTGDGFRIFGNTHLATDGGSGACVVTGDHLDADTCLLAGGDGFDGLGPGRIDDPDQPHKLQILIEVSESQVAFVFLDLPSGGGKDAQTLTAKCVDLSLPKGEIEWFRTTGRGALLSAAAEQPVRSSLEQDPQAISRHSVERGHKLVLRLEGNDRQSLVARSIEVRLLA